MALIEIDRQAVRDHFMRRFGTALTKVILRTSIDNVDAWLDANLASLDAALPVAARTGFTLQEKTVTLCLVLLRRGGFPVDRI